MEEKKRMASCLVDYEHDLWNPIQIRKAPCSEKKGKKRKQQKNKKNTHLSNLWCAVVVVSNIIKGRFLESIIWSLAFLSISFCHQNSDPSKHYPIKMAFGQITSHIWCFGRSSLRTNWSPKTQQLHTVSPNQGITWECNQNKSWFGRSLTSWSSYNSNI